MADDGLRQPHANLIFYSSSCHMLCGKGEDI